MTTILPKFKLIIGLGNPGVVFKNTYHNVGYLAVDYLLKKLSLGEDPKNVRGRFFTATKINHLILLKPAVFMNESGGAVREAVKIFKIPLKEILIIHDDSDILIGRYKWAFARDSAGHRGVESVIKSLKEKNFWRLRIGVRSPKKTEETSNKEKLKRVRAEKIVLRQINSRDKKILYSVLGETIEKLIENEKPRAPSLISVNGNSTLLI
jgi:PTH1 family peptidyl-tRNA hydrolase